MNCGGLLIEPDEVTQRHGIRRFAGFGERIEAQLLFEPGDQDCDGERVETGIEQHQIVGQWRERLAVFAGNLLDLRNNGRLHGHRCASHPLTMFWISVRSSSTPSNISPSGTGRDSAISDSSALKSSCVCVTSHTPCTSVYSMSLDP